MNTIKILLLIAAAGHILCGYCDCLLTYLPGGKKFDVKALSDNKKMAEAFAGMPLKNPLLSMLSQAHHRLGPFHPCAVHVLCRLLRTVFVDEGVF